MRGLITIGLIAALALAANVTYVVTPSGNIHITYSDTGTFLVINFNNNKVLTINAKLNITNATDMYYIHLVGKAVGPYSNSTYAQIAQLLARLRNATGQEALSVLRQLGALLATSNETKELKANIMVVAKALNSTGYNATWLKAKIEYEMERKLVKINGSKVYAPETELEIKGYARDMAKLASVLRALASRIAPYDNKTASDLLYLSQNIANITGKLEIVRNGTVIKVERKGDKFKIEIESEDKNVHDDKKNKEDEVKEKEKKKDEKDKGGSKNGGSQNSNENNDEDEKEEKDKAENKDKGKENDDNKNRKDNKKGK
ncbi:MULTISPECIES: hypothetical protein [Pyrobaculum]|uniref:Uncharacterized protein n=2 Tax=Pyrobaculum arsenaticum TaxID=121277 RepID=A4WLQ9_PYRAR|nr:hypothetical protein [Pyrobaculum arsenaticum]ABP51326.1 conserved hypothetical protein [Pyrobaculum arsenaticum DSM 13514]MCY0889446.1 hypothetical protein [Pyrobaculum arsenaticum]NYR16304.1 hypothetical protein [Pyrobaculum arsenaticum]